ncbi:hypothetical protein KP509_37G025200 [Ceratopteris richardii]|uniref:Major facilitator superfamily (MFS) profile domain-containing protein n=1 Tax=Ceratopteris richardii TaxID=49495 RepID=A0A8T2Q8I2_CERRI|nr:hypothetical protein KP509_37G025200 [Ceratopteris richardii]
MSLWSVEQDRSQKSSLPDTNVGERLRSRFGLGLRMKIPQRYFMVAMVFASTSICYLERVGFSIAYTAAAVSVHTDERTKGYILSAFFYGYVLSQIPGGWAAQRIGPRPVLLVSFLIWSLVCGLTPTADANSSSWAPYLLATARFTIGVAQGLVFPSIHTLLAQWVPPHQRSRAVSLTTSGMYLGAALGMLCVPPLLHRTRPRYVYIFLSSLGFVWSAVWFIFSSDPPRAERAKASSAGFGMPHEPTSGQHVLPMTALSKDTDGSNKQKSWTKRINRADTIPWRSIMSSLPVWAIVVNNFTFHYALYVLMNWLPTYFSEGLRVSLESLGMSKTVPYLNMFIFSNVGGVLADHLIVGRILSVSYTRKLLNTGGFVVAAMALFMMTGVRSSTGALLLSSICLGLCALARAGFAVNHMDIAPKYAGIVMGISNTADPRSWTMVFSTPAILCMISALIFVVFARGERIFD